MNAEAYARSVEPDRRAWRDSMPQRCMVCGESYYPTTLQVHEIARRSSAPRRWGCRSNYLLVCIICHAGPLASMSHVQQLALKLVRDPLHFDLAAWLRIGDPELRAPERVTLADIVDFLKLRDAA